MSPRVTLYFGYMIYKNCKTIKQHLLKPLNLKKYQAQSSSAKKKGKNAGSSLFSSQALSGSTKYTGGKSSAGGKMGTNPKAKSQAAGGKMGSRKEALLYLPPKLFSLKETGIFFIKFSIFLGFWGAKNDFCR